MSLARSAIGVMIARALGVLAAFILTVVASRQFGADRLTDIAFNALILPNAVIVIVGTVLPPVIVSVFKSVQVGKGDEEAWRFSGSALFILTVMAGTVSIAGAAASPFLARILGMGFSGEDISLLSQYLAPAFVVVFFSVMSSALRGILNANESFFVAALDTFVMNSIWSVTAVLAAPKWGVFAYVAGAILGNLGRVLTMVPSYLSRRAWIAGPLIHPEIRGMFSLLWPVLITTTIYGLNVLVTRALATRIPMEGAVSHIFYGEKLALMPGEFLVFAIGAVLLPAMASAAAKGDRGEMRRLTSMGLRVAWILVIPAAVGLALLNEPIVQMLFERGRFGHVDTVQTAGVARILCLGQAFGGQTVLAQGFYATRATRPILLVGLLGLGTNIGLSLLLVGPMRQQGIALAGSVGNIVAFLSYGVLLWPRIGGLELRPIGASLMRVLVASGLMGAALWFGARWALPHLPLGGAVGILIAGGALIYALVLRLLGGDEWRYLSPGRS